MDATQNGYSTTSKLKSSDQVILAARHLLVKSLEFHISNSSSLKTGAIREADIILSVDVMSSSYYINGFIRDAIASGSGNSQIDLEKKLKDLVHYYEVAYILEASESIHLEDLAEQYNENKEKFLQGPEFVQVIDKLLQGFHRDYLKGVFGGSDFSQGFTVKELPRNDGMLIPSTSKNSGGDNNNNLVNYNREQLIGKKDDGSKDSPIRTAAKTAFKYSSFGLLLKASKRRGGNKSD